MPWTEFKKFDEDTGFSLKAGFVLTEKQQDKVHELLRWPKNLNKLEVGCGKTVVSTVVSLMLDYDTTVVTMPPILLTGWTTWLRQVSERVVCYRGTPKERAEMDLASARWILCSHAIFRDDFDVISKATIRKVKLPVGSRFTSREVILDEAHFAKNPKSVLFQKLKKYSMGNVGAQMLTGTPINKPLDAYTYIKIKSPELYKNNTQFEAIHVAERDFFKQPTKFCNLDLMTERLNLQSVSGTKEELHGYKLVPQFPDSSYDLHPEHYKLYAKLVDEQLLEFSDGSVIDVSTAQKLRQALQQVVLNWDYFAADDSKRPAALDLLDLHVEEAEIATKGKSKLLVWVKYKRTAAKLLAYLNGLGVKTVAAYSGADSEKSVQAFQYDESTRALVANPQSCGAGLNPQGVCWEAFVAEVDTVPIYTRQAFGRIDRVGQKHIPRTRIAIARGTVQVGLLHDLLRNDDLVVRIEPTKKGIREMLLGGLPHA